MTETPKTDPEETPEEATDDAPPADDEEAATEAETGSDAPDADPPEADADADPEAALAELNDKLLRALAETENVRRRAERDKADATKYAISNFAREMLTVADNLGRAMESVDPDVRKNDAAVDQVMVGLEMTQREILATFERFGIKPVDAMGKKFDHNVHEAMFEVEDKEKPAGTVVQVLETGYMLADRLLRPAKVGVAKGGPKVADGGGEPSDPGAKEGQTAYEKKGADPGAQLDEEL